MSEQEHYRRTGEHSRAYRVAESPYAKISHLAVTVGLALSILGFGAKMYTDIRTNMDAAQTTDAEVEVLQTKMVEMRERMATEETRLDALAETIDRVEENASQERDAIINRLDALRDTLSSMNEYLRSRQRNRARPQDAGSTS